MTVPGVPTPPEKAAAVDHALRLSDERRQRLESIMAGAASVSSAGSQAATTEVGFGARRCLDLDPAPTPKRHKATARASPDIKRSDSAPSGGALITSYFRRDTARSLSLDDNEQQPQPGNPPLPPMPVDPPPPPPALVTTMSSATPTPPPAVDDTLVDRLELELHRVRQELHEYRTRSTGIIMQLLRQLAACEAREAQEQLIRNNAQLGCRIPSASPHIANDSWEDGELFRALQRKHLRLRQEREDIDRERKLAASRRRKLTPGDAEAIAEEDEKEEILRLRAAMLKREQLKLQAEEIDLECRRKNHIRLSRLLEEESRSRFGNYPVLNQRYVVLQLIGKGGFSEVFKAFDLTEHRTYTRHASREYEIHKQLQHPRIVLLYDVFAIDDQCFCTILEYCDGSDLDMYLKQVEVLPERSARCIMMQIFSGLKYLNSQHPRIVHYDLKPGNILFHKGEIKIADFGLSKLLDSAEDSVELTSPGYGSYWYLPPEVFDDPIKAIVSSKVDVWSAGVIFYQMLFGKRPFGHELTARAILHEKTILHATSIDFPLTKPPVSAEAKQFIRRCLAHRHQDRPTVFEILDDPYLKAKPRASNGTSAAASQHPDSID
ncbi:unnamed protein product (mitochondrion) [Plasmodiophora brassicae]|uniref:Protein kinase domain-containing protein n=1 Tax=Plasmodiophora brassicae TaxID=37360 RepID=A0A3P3YL20_PLABS|nr:unnamed protein product [Plasmodiophora brassicae]